MSLTTCLCRLCIMSCRDFKSLYDESGRGNALYDMILDYFHPKIVDMELAEAKHLTVICPQCFDRISDFHTFQISVMMAQVKLVAEDKKLYTTREEYQNSECFSVVHVKKESIDVSPTRDSDVLEEDAEEMSAIKTSPQLLEHGLYRAHDCDPLNMKSNACTGSNLNYESEQNSTEMVQTIQSNFDTKVSLSKIMPNSASQPARKTLKACKHQPQDSLMLHNSTCVPLDPTFKKYKKVYPKKRMKADRNAAERICPECGKTHFRDSRDFKEHVAFFHLQKPLYTCKFCPETFSWSTAVCRHRKRNHPHESNLDFYVINEDIHSEVNSLGTSAATIEGTASSTTENWHEDRKMQISLPELEIIHVEPEDEDDEEPAPLPGQPTENDPLDEQGSHLKCVACPESYPRLSLLKKHFRVHHPGEEFYIECCSRKIRSRIDQHILLHINPNAFKCSACGVTYQTDVSLRRHTAEQHPEKYSSMYKKHKKHANIKPQQKAHNPKLQCTICDKNLLTYRALREHMAAHQNKDLYTCAFCPRTFRWMGTLVLHRQKKHPQESSINFYHRIAEETTEGNATTLDHGQYGSGSDSSGPLSGAKPMEDISSTSSNGWIPTLKREDVSPSEG